MIKFEDQTAKQNHSDYNHKSASQMDRSQVLKGWAHQRGSTLEYFLKNLSTFDSLNN